MTRRRLAYNSTLPAPEKAMRKISPKRMKELRAHQFGEDGKREWIVSMLCGVTGEPGTEAWPIDPCHVGSPDPDERGQSTRASGADSTYLFPMRRDVHAAFDSLPADKFEELYGVSKQWVRDYAWTLHLEWLKLFREMGETNDEGEEG